MALKGMEPSLGTNAFGTAKYKNESEAVAYSILNLLFGKPGFFPSMPNLGINIQQMMYSFWDDIDPEVLKAQIVSQCREFQIYVQNGTLQIIKSSYMGQPLLLIILPVIVKNARRNLALGIVTDEFGKSTYNFIYMDDDGDVIY